MIECRDVCAGCRYRDWCILLVLGLAGCMSMPLSNAVEEHVVQLNDDGNKMFAHGEFDKACESFLCALELSPRDSDLAFNLAQCHDRLGRYHEAEQYYVQCLQQSPAHVEARYSLGMLYVKTNRKEPARRLIEEWMQRQPRSADPYALDGWRLRQEKDHFSAQGRLQQALGLDPQNVHALTEMAILYESMGLPDRALELYDRALVRNPRQPEIQMRVDELRASNVGRPQPD